LLENALPHTGADAALEADLEDGVNAGIRLQDFRLRFGLNPTPAQFRSFPLARADKVIELIPPD
jgi:hypothetical protein